MSFVVRWTRKHWTRKSGFSCKKRHSSGKQPLQYSYQQLESTFLFVQDTKCSSIVFISICPWSGYYIFYVFHMLLFHDCRFMLYLLFCPISSCWQIFVLFFHIKSFQDTCITKPDGRSFILSNPHRDVDDTAFPSCSVLYIIFPLAFFQKRLINKPLFHFFPLSQNDHKDSKIKLHLKKKSWVCFLWQKNYFCLPK